MESPEQTEGEDCLLSLTFSRQWRHVPLVRTFIQTFLLANMVDQSRTTPDRVAMAAGELMENAVKYSAQDKIHLTVEIFQQARPSLRLSIENKASPENQAEVAAIFRRITEGDSMETYLAMMKEAALRGDGRSQLGLIRIRHESGCHLRLNTTADAVQFILETEGGL